MDWIEGRTGERTPWRGLPEIYRQRHRAFYFNQINIKAFSSFRVRSRHFVFDMKNELKHNVQLQLPSCLEQALHKLKAC
jgi:hypothetical protein